MNGGYQMIDLSGINFTTDADGSEVTDEEFKKKFIDVCASGKPVLVYGFRGFHGPNFGSVLGASSGYQLSVQTTVNANDNSVWTYMLWYNPATDKLTAYSRNLKFVTA